MKAAGARTGLVVERHRRHVTVEDSAGRRWMCQPSRRSLQPLIGDEVEWREAADGTGVVTKLRERRSTLSRIDSRGRRELVAANLTQLYAVAAPAPAPDWLVVDHYLVAAALAGLAGALVLNKADLTEAPAHVDCYRRAGYPLFRTSAATRAGLDSLAEALRGERAAFVGQSGVGKSSLLNALLGESVQSVGELTGKGAHGRHTTSSAVLHRLPGGGEVIDAPGVRAYAPHIADPTELQHGFREFRPYAGQCRFDNCRHLAEPGCAIKTAVDAGDICRRRYESYERLYALIGSLRTKRGN
ncbi:MAG: ribosome small subunit-dependent GTPase A [Gammaproteobacteria bacterium]|nr:ribosome small subunit-dependent GTPase A [Gammaproteobacteria bacterium]